MINFVVVDDNELHVKRVENLILSCMMNNKIDFKIEIYNDYSSKLLNFIRKNKKNTVYILDLELPNGDGIDIARFIRNDINDWINPIIILSVHTSLYYEVYKQRLQILDFVGKCCNLEKNLEENIDICIRMFNLKKTFRFVYKNIEYSIPLDKINYFRKQGRKLEIVTTDKIYYLNESICAIKKTLPPYFVNSIKGVLINTKNVNQVDWKQHLVYFADGSKDYLVSRNHRKELSKCELG